MNGFFKRPTDTPHKRIERRGTFTLEAEEQLQKEVSSRGMINKWGDGQPFIVLDNVDRVDFQFDGLEGMYVSVSRPGPKNRNFTMDEAREIERRLLTEYGRGGMHSKWPMGLVVQAQEMIGGNFEKKDIDHLRNQYSPFITINLMAVMAYVIWEMESSGMVDPGSLARFLINHVRYIGSVRQSVINIGEEGEEFQRFWVKSARASGDPVLAAMIFWMYDSGAFYPSFKGTLQLEEYWNDLAMDMIVGGNLVTSSGSGIRSWKPSAGTKAAMIMTGMMFNNRASVKVNHLPDQFIAKIGAMARIAECTDPVLDQLLCQYYTATHWAGSNTNPEWAEWASNVIFDPHTPMPEIKPDDLVTASHLGAKEYESWMIGDSMYMILDDLYQAVRSFVEPQVFQELARKQQNLWTLMKVFRSK